MDEVWWEGWFRPNFERVGGFERDRVQSNLRRLFAYLEGKRVIIVHGNTRHGKWSGINQMNAAINEVVEATVGHLATVLHLDDIIERDDEVIDLNHFRREVYMRLANLIAEELRRPVGAVAVAKVAA